MNGVKTLNIKGRLFTLDEPLVMGILNVTPDSFFPESRMETEERICGRIETILTEGGRIVDVGGCSTRPNAPKITAEEEWRRLTPTLTWLSQRYPEALTSIDTFRAEVARRAVEEYGVAMVNDVSGGELDAQMFETVARLQTPYVLTHMRGTPQTMQQLTDYSDLMEEIILHLAKKLQTLRLLGVNDVIIDPGFGFAKTTEQNYELMRRLSEFGTLECPLLVGVSRKRMISQALGLTTEESLHGTTALHTFALLHGADILRVHDVKAAVDTVKTVARLKTKTAC
ncbi:MAG: dihydropteroate synthase [Tannerella sp.]|jgi:dihydropteroate synthase|nr:dihydropteroate synthase [Tannerella sp.]